MFMNHKFLILFIIIFNQVAIHAQEWGKGQIITINNDTLDGFVATGLGNNFHKICYYRIDSQSEARILDNNTIQILAFDKGQVFEFKELKTNKRKGKFLVERLLKGIVNLYYLECVDSVKYHPVEKNITQTGSNLILDNTTKVSRIYLAEMTAKNGLILELPSPQNESSGYLAKKRNEQMLQMIFDQHPEMVKSIKNVSYNRESMISLFKTYHDLVCTEYACIAYMQKKDKRSIHITPYFCFEINQLQFNELYVRPDQSGWHKTSKNQPAVELVSGFDIIPFSKKAQLNVGIKLANVNFTHEIKNNRYEVYGYEVSAFQLMPSLSLSYNLFLSGLNPLIEVGTYSSFLLNQKANEVRTYFNNITEVSPYAYKSPIFGFFISSGIDIKINKNHAIPVRIMYHVAPYNLPPIDVQGSFAYSFLTLKAGYSFEL